MKSVPGLLLLPGRSAALALASLALLAVPACKSEGSSNAAPETTATTTAVTATTATTTTTTTSATSALPPASSPHPVAPPLPPQKPLPSPTLERAGGPTCALESPTELTSAESARAGYGSAFGGGAKIAFGPSGGLVAWPGADGPAHAIPLGPDGHPTGPVQSFPADSKFYTSELLPFDGGFALFYMISNVISGTEKRYVQILAPSGEARGSAIVLDMAEHIFDGVSPVVAGRFVVFGGPRPSKDKLSTRLIVVHIDPAGNARQEPIELPISQPVRSRPSFVFALDREHWAMTVQGGPPLDGKGSAEALVVDGVLAPVQGMALEGAPASLAQMRQQQLAWNGDELAVKWVIKGPKKDDPVTVAYAHLARNGTFRPESGGKKGEPALRKLFEERVRASYGSAQDYGTTIMRDTSTGESLGEPVFLNGPLPDVGKGLMDADVAWSGDRFVVVYAPSAGGTTFLRTVALRCESSAKRPGR